MTGPWVLRLRCMRSVLEYLLPTEQIAYCEALMLPPPVAQRHRYKNMVTKRLSEVYYTIGEYKHGPIKRFSKNGQLIFSAMCVNGKLHGMKYRWYEDGTPRECVFYNHGIKDGVLRMWKPHGILSEESFYQNGKLEGLFQKWNESGELIARKNFKQGRLHGLSEGFVLTGAWQKCYYQKGIPHGLREDYCYDVRGQRRLKKRLNYEYGKKEGLAERWHLNGQLCNRRYFQNGEMEGPSESYDHKGKLIERNHFKNGKLHGLCERWDPCTREMKPLYFNEGKRVKNEECLEDLSLFL